MGGETIRLKQDEAKSEAREGIADSAEDPKAVLKEIVERSGLLLEVDRKQYIQFAHITFQEYFAALEVLDRPEFLIAQYQNDPVQWWEPVRLWCGATQDDATAVIRAVHDEKSVLALECLADADKVDESLANEIIDYYLDGLGQESRGSVSAVVAAFGAVAADPRPRGREVFRRLMLIVQSPNDERQSTAIAALAATDTPDAASLLAEHISVVDHARNALLGMGDIALPQLTQRVGANPELVDDLAKIGTQSAIQTLVSLLNKSGQVAVRAAWNIAAMVADPDGEEALRSVSIRMKGERLDWVWIPFGQGTDDPVVKIVGRAAYLLDISADDSHPAAPKLDPRLVIPICWVRAPLNFRLPIERKDLHVSFAEEVPYWNALVSAGLSAHHGTLLRAIDLPERRAFVARMIKLVTTINGVSRLTVDARSNPFRIDDWERVNREARPYRFDTGWHYRVTVLCAMAVSLIAVRRAANIVALPWAFGWFRWGAVVVIVWGWTYLIFRDVFSSPDMLLNFGVRGAIRADPPNLRGVRRIVAAPCRLLAPVVIYLYLAFSVSHFGWRWTVGSLALSAVVVTALIQRGRRREARERRENPLRGLLPTASGPWPSPIGRTPTLARRMAGQWVVQIMRRLPAGTAQQDPKDIREDS
jgi:hypothetical protein